MCREHPKADKDGFVAEHVLVAEKALGHYLPFGAAIHHFDENRQNNSNNNLVICENHAYHKLLHRRIHVLRAGGNPNTDKICCKCKKVKNRCNFGINSTKKDRRQDMCYECKNEYSRKKYWEKN